MIICLVTDRRRADPLTQARAACAAGIDLIQIRERDLDASHLASLVREIVAATRGTRTRVVVNDRLDVALGCGADGVHLRADSIPVAAARRLAPAGFLVGQSVHSVAEALSAPDADYLIAGTVFATPSKPGRRAHLGENGLRQIVQAVRVPVLAIGGVSPETVETIARTGAAGIAAIGLFVSGGAFEPLVGTLRSRFDTAKTAP